MPEGGLPFQVIVFASRLQRITGKNDHIITIVSQQSAQGRAYHASSSSDHYRCHVKRYMSKLYYSF